MAVRVYSRCFLLVLCAFVCVSELLFSSGFGVSGLRGLGLYGSFRKLGSGVFFAVAPPGLFRLDVVPQTFFVIV